MNAKKGNTWICEGLRTAARFFFVSWRGLESGAELLGLTRRLEAMTGGEGCGMGEERAALEYSRLVCGTGDRALPLWGSAIRGQRDTLLDKSTLEVVRIYHDKGLMADPAYGQPADYIGTQLAFLSYLAAEGAKEWFARFRQEHFMPLAEELLKLLRSERDGCLYKVTAASVKLAAGYEGGEPVSAELPPGLIRFPESLEAGFDKERIVPTHGRGNCGGRCIVKSHVVNGCITGLSSDDSDGSDGLPVLRACARGYSYRRTFLSTKRLRYPMKRIGERGQASFVRISWDEALDTIARECKRVKELYGPASRYVNSSSGVYALLRGDDFARRLLALDGGYLERYNTYSSACAKYVTPYVYGTSDAGAAFYTLRYSELIVLWAFNPVETNYGSEVISVLAAAKGRGVPIVVVDPRYNDTAAAFADEWIPLRPGTDSALADAMAYVIVSEGLHDKAFLDKYCIGFDREHMPEGSDPGDCLLDYLNGTWDGIKKSPEWAEPITGVSAARIYGLARRYAKLKPAALLPGLGHQRHANGEQSVRSLCMLACITGNVGKTGGHSGGYNHIRLHAIPEIPQPPNPCPYAIPSFLWTRAISSGAEMTRREDGVRGGERLPSPIKLIFNIGGNLLMNQHSDCFRTAEILKDDSLCEFIVCSDVFMTPGARYADIVLPAASMFECSNINVPWDTGNFLLYSSPAAAPLWECRDDYDWLLGLAERLGAGREFSQGHSNAESWMRALYEKLRQEEPELPDYGQFSRAMGHKYRHQPENTAFKKQIEDPERHPFPTPSGKIELYSERLKSSGELPAIPRYVPSFEGPESADGRYPLQLIGFHVKNRCHSIHGNNEAMEDLEPHRLWINPEDAARRGLTQGDEAEVFNDRGRLRICVYITRRIMPGVAAIPQGAWFRPEGGVDMGGNINTLTTQRPSPLARGNPQHSNLVEVIKAGRKEAGRHVHP